MAPGTQEGIPAEWGPERRSGGWSKAWREGSSGWSKPVASSSALLRETPRCGASPEEANEKPEGESTGGVPAGQPEAKSDCKRVGLERRVSR